MYYAQDRTEPSMNKKKFIQLFSVVNECYFWWQTSIHFGFVFIGTHQAQVVFAIELHYLADKCPKERNARPDSNFIAFYTQYLATLSGWYGNEDCTIESVERPVKCAEPGIRFGRRRIVYSKQGIKVPLSVRFVVKVLLPSNVSFADLNQTTQGLSSNVLTSLETDQPLNISGVVLEHDASKPPDIRVDGLVCDKGQVLKGTKCGKTCMVISKQH